MKLKLFIGFIALFTALSIFYLRQSSDVKQSAESTDVSVEAEGKGGAQPVSEKTLKLLAEKREKYQPPKATPVKLNRQERLELEQASEEKRQQIKKLLAEYETQLGNPEKKQAIKQQLDELMAEYNELTLPLALKAMEQNGSTN